MNFWIASSVQSTYIEEYFHGKFMDGAYYISKSTECISVKSDVGL
jgi:hypothetical protein